LTSLCCGLFIELACSVCEVLELDTDDLFEKILANTKAEAMILAL
jgi:DNA-binding XRE family transcriptional regulator